MPVIYRRHSILVEKYLTAKNLSEGNLTNDLSGRRRCWLRTECGLIFANIFNRETAETPMRFLLKLKHWQLFLITWGIPIAINIYTFSKPAMMVKLFPVMM